MGIFLRRDYPSWLITAVDKAYGWQEPVSRYPMPDRTGALSCSPLLVVSAGRSGTTLLRSMLVVGGQIAIPPESYVFSKAVWKFARLQYFGWRRLCQEVVSLFESHPTLGIWEVDWSAAHERVRAIPPKDRSLAKMIDEIFRMYAEAHFPNALCWGDQTPLNTRYLPWVFRAFPNAKYLHVLRDGRDAIASHLRVRGECIERATRVWVNSIARARKLQSQLPAGQFMEVRYEELVGATAATLQAICQFVGIEYCASMLEYWKSPTTVEHKHFSIHRNLSRPVFSDSVGKWRERLSVDEQRYVQGRAGGLLEQLGYEKRMSA